MNDDRNSSLTPDEPVIGETYVPRYDSDSDAPDDWDEYGDQYDDDPGYDDDGYYDDVAARQPIFYVFIGLAVVLGGAFIFLLFTLVNRNDDDANPGGGLATQTVVDARIRIDSPLANDRIEINKQREVLVTASATEEIANFELYIDDKLVDRIPGGAPDLEKIYHARLNATIGQKGEHSIFVRLITISGAKQDSEKVQVVAIEPVGETTPSIQGRVLTLTTLRAGPIDTANSLGEVREGQQVKVTGRTSDNEWLFVDVAPGGWIKRNAVELLDALSIVPIQNATATPATATPQTTVTPGATISPTPANLPDLAPANGQLFDGGSGLRISVSNLATTAYGGALEVSVTGLTTGTLTRVFAVNVPPGGAVTVDFELDPPITQQRTATIRIDPANAVRESNEDNNQVSISLVPPVEAPAIVIAEAKQDGDFVDIRIRNDGGQMNQTTVTVAVQLGGASNTQAQTLTLAKGATANFRVAAPGAGSGRVVVTINGTPVASVEMTLTP